MYGLGMQSFRVNKQQIQLKAHRFQMYLPLPSRCDERRRRRLQHEKTKRPYIENILYTMNKYIYPINSIGKLNPPMTWKTTERQCRQRPITE